MSRPPSAAEVEMTPAAAQLHDAEAILSPGQSAPIDLTIFVSCYNEEPYILGTIATIRDALQRLPHVSYEIVVIDDCSLDRSADLVSQYILKNSDVRILLRRNKINRGLAQSYCDAAFIGKGKYFRLICGDDAEPADTIAAVISEVGQADILIPYYVTAEGKSVYRQVLSRAFTGLVNLISGHRLHYYNGLAVHLRYNVLRWHSNTRGFGFQADLACLLLDQGFSYKQIPVRTVERKGRGSTALTFKNLLSVAHTLFELMLRRIANRVYRRDDV
jgi:glycosyltransferase involved in cell wall biosynthesis